MRNNRKLTRKLMAIGLCFGLLLNTAHAETVVGRWCDIMIPGNPDYYAIKEIVITDVGDVEMRSLYRDGSMGTEKLVKQDAQHYLPLNGHGEKYRIDPDTGNLELTGEIAPLRVAIRLGNTPRFGECEM